MSDNAAQYYEDNVRNLPTNLPPVGDLQMFNDMPPSMRILLDDNLFKRAQQIADIMSKDDNMPRHLRGKSSACFNIICQAFDWRLSWNYVAAHTYQTPGGGIGYMGALVHAIMEKSGRFTGSPKFEFSGEWNRIVGKYEMVRSERTQYPQSDQNRQPKEYPRRTWGPKDIEGLGVVMSWQLKGEAEPRYWPDKDMPFMLSQVSTFNSPLWATDPLTQIKYLIVRRFASQSVPSIMGSFPFDTDEFVDASERARDITPANPPPRPTREQFTAPDPEPEPVQDTPEPEFEVVDHVGEVHSYSDGAYAIGAYKEFLTEADKARGSHGLKAVWENNEALRQVCGDKGWLSVTHGMKKDYLERLVAAEQRERAEAGNNDAPAAAASSTAPSPAPAVSRAGLKPRNLIWKNPNLAVRPWISRGGETDWRRYQITLDELISETETVTELNRLWNDNDEHLQRMAKDAAPLYSALLGATSRRQDALSAAAETAPDGDTPDHDLPGL